ncbi:MAG: restriction endonuclease subunit S [Acidobacteria bacterium]|nr:restriction endonuclease subunit S [Acidobacteriota bacterium]
MTATNTITPRVFAVWWKDLHRWGVKSFQFSQWQWPPGVIKKLTFAMERICEPVDKASFNLMPEHFLSLRFTGEVELRELHGKSEFKGTLFFARAGDIIYSKIDVRNGAIGIVPAEVPVATVTSEFPVYRIKKHVALPEYIQLVFRTEHFRRIINGMVSGTSGRKRVQPDDLENVEVPLPPLAEQKAIVARWQKAQQAVDAARGGLSKPVRFLNGHLTEVYRSTCTRDVIHSRCFVLDFKELATWDVKSGRAASFRLACPSFRPMGDFIEEATEPVRPATEPEKDWPVYGVNNKEGVFLNSHQKGSTFNAPYKRIRKDWFFHNPTRCNVGSLGIVPDVPEDAITSPEYQVWRLKPYASQPLLSGYVACLIQTPFFLDLVQFNRVGAVKQRMYTENLMQVHIPYLPVPEQQRYADDREKAITIHTAAKRYLDDARKEVEALILGTKKVSEL